MAHVRVRDLTRAYPGGRGVHGLSFDVLPGRVTGLIGPNGSGKSTTLGCMVGLVRCSGAVTYDGLPYREAVWRGSIGVQLDASAAHPRRTARAHLLAVAAGRGATRDRVEEILAEVGLSGVAERRVGTFSMGMRQRVGVAGALLARPDTMLLDEPTNGLDPHGVRWLRERLAAEAAAGAAVLVSSHALGDLEQIVDDLVILGEGTARATGSLHDIVVRFGERRVHLRLGSGLDLVLPLLLGAGAQVHHRDDGLLVLEGIGVDDVARTAHRVGALVLELTERNGDLHEAYLTACGAA